MNFWAELRLLTGILLLIGGGLQNIQAQSGQVEEKTVNLEKLLIEANLERILGNYDKSIKLYEQVLKDDATNDAAYYELARLHDVKGADDEAIRFAKKAVDLARKTIGTTGFWPICISRLAGTKKQPASMST